MNLTGSKIISRGRGGRSLEVWLKVPAESMLKCMGVLCRSITHETDDILERYNSAHANRRMPKLPSLNPKSKNE
jgi:hypothetical protein